jgi:hypothetical protein
MNARPVLAVALAVLFVTAGCQAPAAPTDATTSDAATTTQSATTTSEPTTRDYVTVEGDLDVDVERIYRRVGRMLDVAREDWPNTSVRVRPADDSGSIGMATTYGFTNLVGIEPEPSAGDDGGVGVGAVARGLSVTLYDHPTFDEAAKRNILAHEFVHVLQTQLRPRPAVAALDDRRDRRFLVDTMVEGSAEYVQERYGVRYQNFTVNQTELGESWRNASAYVRLRLAPYEYGSRYFALRVDGPSEVADVYEQPPRTAEQVLHGLAPDSERAKPLTIAANASGSPMDVDGTETKGELFVRLALSTELNWTRAADASTGWGMDRLVEFGGQGDRGYAWVLRWDDPSEASEFAAAFRDYNETSEEAFRLASVTDETVVVYGGADYFVANATATGTTGNVTVHAS